MPTQRFSFFEDKISVSPFLFHSISDTTPEQTLKWKIKIFDQFAGVWLDFKCLLTFCIEVTAGRANLKKEKKMNAWKRWLLILGAGIVGLNIILLAASFFSVNLLVDFWWFDSLGYGFYFLQRLFYRYVVLILVTLFFFLVFFLNFWVASRYLGTTESPSEDNKSDRVNKDLLQMFRTGSMRVYSPLSVLLGILVAWPLFEQWEKFLLYIFGPSMGVKDPVFSKDISYYLFSYPIYTLIQRRLLLAFFLLLAAMLLLYWLEKRLLSQQDQNIPAGAKRHLSILILIIFFIEIWHYALQAYGLLYSSNHQTLFFGPGFVEMWITFPLICQTFIFLMGTAFSLIFFIHKHKGLKVLIAFAVLFLLSFGARYSPFLPNLVEKYIVKPNEISREKPFIIRNIESTLAAYNLTDVETRDFSPERVPTNLLDSPTIKAELRNIPVWDGELLEDVYNQLQKLRTYYDFAPVDVGRYTVNNNYQQVFLAARELDQKQLPEGARNWVNQHLTYTHGYGAVMTPASQGGDEPLTWFLHGIPPISDYGFSIEQPGIYHGLGTYNYSIAPNDAGEFDYPKGNTNALTNYTGTGGVPLASIFKKLLFSYYFMDRDIFFTTKTNRNSRILFRQNIVERIKTLTPYFLLDKDPYLVVTKKNLFWIQDAYVTSSMYPYAAPYSTIDGQFNYIRNSVKIVVDAYNGTVDYYVFDLKDPIIQAYRYIYPGVFKSKESMPSDLLQQTRYPRDLFDIQMSIYAKYQQRDPEVFYQQEDMWEPAKTYQGKEVSSIKPYYLTLDLIDPKRFDFLLLAPMSPKGRDNLRALALAGCDPPYYGKIIVYNFPKGELIYGPPQISALINQDTTIAQQFTLWDQIGSRVALGKMIILPVGKVIIYIQPVYLKASAELKIPELKRLIMSQGQIVVMERSLEDAYAKLQERIKAEIERVDTRFAPLMPGAPPPEEGLSPHVEQ